MYHIGQVTLLVSATLFWKELLFFAKISENNKGLAEKSSVTFI